MEEFETIARRAGYSNFRREGKCYCHAELEVFYRGYMAGRASIVNHHD